MITCEEILRGISDYIDEDMTPDLKANIESHICKCHHCEVLVNTCRKTVTLVWQNSSLELPKGVSERLLAKIKAKTGCKPQS
jgi:hypothetical protein